jgi:hypothetical protein
MLELSHLMDIFNIHISMFISNQNFNMSYRLLFLVLIISFCIGISRFGFSNSVSNLAFFLCLVISSPGLAEWLKW